MYVYLPFLYHPICVCTMVQISLNICRSTQICRHLACVLVILPVMQIAWLEKLKTNSNSSVYPQSLHFCFPFLSPLVCERLPALPAFLQTISICSKELSSVRILPLLSHILCPPQYWRVLIWFWQDIFFFLYTFSILFSPDCPPFPWEAFQPKKKCSRYKNQNTNRTTKPGELDFGKVKNMCSVITKHGQLHCVAEIASWMFFLCSYWL